jgi:hypothetical protein
MLFHVHVIKCKQRFDWSTFGGVELHEIMCQWTFNIVFFNIFWQLVKLLKLISLVDFYYNVMDF